MTRSKPKTNLTIMKLRLIPAILALVCAGSAGYAYTQSDTDRLVDWLYHNISYPDSVMYSRQFYADNAEATLRAREEMPWGKTVPEREFLHFVLPVRVNNEALDMARPVFYEELAPRVKGLSMAEAIQEVNHWCHEKVTYRPSDARTSPPLSTVSQGIGRCGEESTFTVAALRSVGIPARQIYTPRWAHTDDNHAWVEAWADGKWYFLGACEPAPLLDMAWFNEPASRGLLMHTDVTGQYGGPEEVIARRPLLTTINVTSNYAPTGKSTVTVTDAEGKPVAGADVIFGIYNYSEFYPAVTRKSDAKGQAELISGLGDMIVWATDGARFGLAKVNPKMEMPVKIVLDKDASYTGGIDFDIVPPKASAKLPRPSAEAEAENNRRLAQEDSIRNASAQRRFVGEKEARDAAAGLILPADEMVEIMELARGNGRAILAELGKLTQGERNAMFRMLQSLTVKDLRDIPAEVLADNLEQAQNGQGDFHFDYVVNPRVDYEPLVPYKHALRRDIPKKLAKEWKKNPQALADWAVANLQPLGERNPKNTRMTPTAVWKSRHADPLSRSIFTVAALRSLDVPARIDPVTGKTQYADKGVWRELSFGKSAAAVSDNPHPATVRYTDTSSRTLPKYYYQFSIIKIEDGKPHRLEFDDVDVKQLNDSLRLDEGQYMLLSGTRMADGGVLAHAEFFNVAADGEASPLLTMRRDNSRLSVIGNVNAENIYHDLAADTDKSLLSTTGRGYYVIALIKPNDEPSSHILNDLIAEAPALDKLGRKIMVLFTDKEAASRLDRSAFKGLPETVVFGIDNGGKSLDEIATSLNLETKNLPIIVVADTFNRIVYATQGYTIGTGGRLAEILTNLQNQ